MLYESKYGTLIAVVGSCRIYAVAAYAASALAIARASWIHFLTQQISVQLRRRQSAFRISRDCP